MAREGHTAAAGGEAGSRLVYGIADGRRRSRWHAAAAVATARLIDGAVGHLGLCRPVLLVSGFWRSGTTWVQEVIAETLGAKTVFEPLSPQEPAWRRRLPPWGEDRLQALIPGPSDDPALWSYLARTTTGRRTSPFLMSCRRTVGESARPLVVVKDVRLQCNLAAFHHRFGVPVLHVRRHPCAVVASLIAAEWHWSFARVRLADLVPALGRNAPPPEAYRAYDTDAASRIAAWWAITESVAATAMAGQPWARLIGYEAMLQDPGGAIAAACAGLGLQRVRTVDAARPSASVHPDVFAAYGLTPRERWPTLLDPSTADRVQAIADALCPDWRLALAAPAHPTMSPAEAEPMSDRTTDTPAQPLPPPSPDAARDAKARAAGEARFGTPIEADAPVNPDLDSEQPFSDRPEAERS